MGPSFIENKPIFIKRNVRLIEAVRGVKGLNDVDFGAIASRYLRLF
jgi:hypothetical protein